MKNYITILLFCCSSILFAQTYPHRHLGSFVLDNTAYIYEFTGENPTTFGFRITNPNIQSFDQSDLTPPAEEKKSSSTENARDSLTIATDSVKTATTSVNSQKDTVKYIFASFTKPVFETIFISQMTAKFHVPDNQKLRDKATEIFFSITANLNLTDEQPVTANLILRRNSIYSLLKTNNSVYYNGPLAKFTAKHNIDKVDVEMAEGAMKNLKVHLVPPYVESAETSPRNYLEFKNIYPISIAGKYDAETFANIRLYCLNCSGIKGLNRFIRLSDLLLFDIVLQNEKEDYSPANSTITLKPSAPIVELKKEKTSRILEVSGFTDFVGLDQEEPNGILQIEAKRRINIVTTSRQVWRFDRGADFADQLNLSELRQIGVTTLGRYTIYKLQRPLKEGEIPVFPDMQGGRWSKKILGKVIEITKDGKLQKAIEYEMPIKNKRFHHSYWSFLNSVEPKLLFSKLEQNNRFLDSSKLEQNKISPIQLYRYQLASFGASLSLIRFSYPQLKFSWNALTVGGYWFRTRVGNNSDSTSNSIPLNSSYASLSTEAVFRPDNRWGATIGFNWIRTYLFNNEFTLSTKRPILQPYFEAFLKTNDTNKLFFRFRWTSQYKEKSSNFTQIQLGYSMNIFVPNPSK